MQQENFPLYGFDISIVKLNQTHESKSHLTNTEQWHAGAGVFTVKREKQCDVEKYFFTNRANVTIILDLNGFTG